MTTPAQTGHIIECGTCHARTVVTDEGLNAHDALTCACCGDDHVHAGPDGSTVLQPHRTLIIHANATALPGGEN